MNELCCLSSVPLQVFPPQSHLLRLDIKSVESKKGENLKKEKKTPLA